ncbi:DUF2750 domain-containing protein [Metabacillus sp. cB07]|uniref:DUF2750 domain-containing protein n=1 Tax=Metabacillus sp. cB07 TaxID=2806989 RepID=UPI001F5C56E4|nr:DUF2750 domain-containing protein [Metabacillus sp. cB07]
MIKIKINNAEINAVNKLPENVRYEYFIKKVTDYEEVWGLFNDGWATSRDEDGNLFIPFFPKKEFAEISAVKEWASYEARSITLDDFIENWLTGMKKAGINPSIFPLGNETAAVSIDNLLKDLETELENY